PPPTAAQVVMIDCSTSMSGTKLAEAKRATGVAIDTLRDDVAFAVISGTSSARVIYPPKAGALVPASAATRAQAKEAVRGLRAHDGTAIGTWLALADRLLDGHPARIKHAILLTDGRNQHQTEAEFRRDLERCRGHFVCDSRGVGTEWEAAPLLAIAETLLGSASGLTEPDRLAADFQAVTEAVMGKAVADVSLRLWTPADTKIRFLKQVHPVIVDLTERGTPAGGERTRDYPTGQWGEETKDFHLSVEVPAGLIGDERAAARVSVAVGERELAERTVWIHWTDDLVLSTRINPQVAHYTGQIELAETIQEGLAARAKGEVDVANAKLGRAVQLATESGNHETVKVLAKVVEVVDAVQGTVRLRHQMEAVDAELAGLQSRRTIRTRNG
ncbi:VWA domain-containing protein, partial [Amycolatopsis samaneae]